VSALETQTARSPRLAQEELECPPARLNVCAWEFAGPPEQQVRHLSLSLLGLTTLPFACLPCQQGLLHLAVAARTKEKQDEDRGVPCPFPSRAQHGSSGFYMRM